MQRYRFVTLLLMSISGPSAGAGDAFEAQRAAMVRDIRETVEQTSGYIGKSQLDKRVMQAVAVVPRHEFVPVNLRRLAYLNQPLPIGHEQTISQPYIVALMTDLAEVDENSIVLEIGTGSGYQAAVLAEFVRHVYTIEIIDALGRTAEQTLRRLGYDNVTVRLGDGYHGWREHAPFDAILVTAAAERVPVPLIEQLKPGGRLVIPIGAPYRSQSLQVISKDAAGKITVRDVLPVGFVPLTGEN